MPHQQAGGNAENVVCVWCCGGGGGGGGLYKPGRSIDMVKAMAE